MWLCITFVLQLDRVEANNSVLSLESSPPLKRVRTSDITESPNMDMETENNSCNKSTHASNHTHHPILRHDDHVRLIIQALFDLGYK